MSHFSTAFWAVIPAAGVGARMAADRPKQYLQLGAKAKYNGRGEFRG